MQNHGDVRGRGRSFARIASIGVAFVAAVFLSGCFVSPNPISEQEHWDRAKEDMGSLYWEQETPTHPISLPEAIARAVKYNLDHRLSMMESAFHMNQLDVANLGMLPRLALNAGYTVRSNESASTSIGYYDRQESLRPSVSTEQSHGTYDLSLSWSMLDFGLSYFQARQQADRFLIIRERRRRIMNNLVKDVINDYFRVATTERIGPQVAETLKRAEEALETYSRLEQEKKGPLSQALEQQRALMTIISHLRSVSVQMAAAKSRLAALMNLPLSSNLAIVVPSDDELAPPRLVANLPALESIGIYMRPDLREEMYQSRIDATEVKKDILRMIPGINLFSSLNGDTNKYLVHNAWAEAGARVTMDIIGVAGKWKQVKSSKMQQHVTRTRRLAGTVAALVQIHMSFYQYQQAVDMFADSKKMSEIDERILEVGRASARAKEAGALDQVRQAAIALTSRMERDRQLLEVLGAWGNLYFSIGGDIIGRAEGTEDLATLTCIASRGLAEWLAGVVPEMPESAPYLVGNVISDTPFVESAVLPAVLSASDEMKREAEESANKPKEEEKEPRPAGRLKRTEKAADAAIKPKEPERGAGTASKPDTVEKENGATNKPRTIRRPTRNRDRDAARKQEKTDNRVQAEVLTTPPDKAPPEEK